MKILLKRFLPLTPFFLVVTLMTINSYAVLNKQSFEVALKWECLGPDHGKKALTLPKNEQVKVKMTVKQNGQLKFRLKNNIFNNSFGNKVKRLFKKVAGKSKDIAINSSDCLKDFKSRFSKSIESEIAKNCETKACPDSQTVLDSFDSYLSGQSYFQKKKELPSIPRFYTGHQDISSSDKDFERQTVAFCANKRPNFTLSNTNNTLTYLFTSRAYIEYIKEQIENRNRSKVFDYDCLAKIEDISKKYNDINCKLEIDTCKIINSRKYPSEDLNFVSNLKKLHKKDLKEKIEPYGFDFDTSEEERKSVTQMIKNIAQKHNSSGNSGYCLANRKIIDSEGEEKSIYAYDKVIEKNLNYIMKNFSSSCLKNFIEYYVSQKYEKSNPLEDKYCEQADCEKVKETLEIFNQNLNQLTNKRFGERGTQHLCLKQQNFKTPYRDFQALLNQVEDIRQCAPLGVDEYKVVSSVRRNSPTGLPMGYLLERESPKELKASLVINFTGSKRVSGNEMLLRVQKCIEQTSTYFTSDSGETIRVKVYSPEEAKVIPGHKRPPTHKVKVASVFRSSASQYEESIGCAAITHELLHLMGLCDEYEEKNDGAYVNTETGKVVPASKRGQKNIEWKTAYNHCRAIAPLNIPSIMTSHSYALERNIALKKTCLCRSGDSVCNMLKNTKDTKLFKLFTSDIFATMNNYKSVCSHKLLSSKYINSSEQVKNLSGYEETDRSENSLSFNSHVLTVKKSKSFSARADYYQFDCSCKKGDLSCEDELKKLMSLSSDEIYAATPYCPSPTYEKDDVLNNQIVSRDDINELRKIHNRKDSEGNIQIVKFPPKNSRNSLLMPAHFERIMGGTCSSAAKLYSQCAKFAYIGVGKDCPERPKECSEVDKWLYQK